jgi:hypothetical protein
MIEALRIVLSPLSYLSAKNPTKAYWDYIIPALVGAAVCVLFILPGFKVAIFGEKGVVHGVNELIQVLVGFYIAALAAVASLANPALDRGIDGDPIKLKQAKLTRRQFLCLAFSYLSLLSICIYGAGLLANLTAGTVRASAPPALLPYFRGIFGLMYGFFVAQMACITSVTLYYLGERIHVAQLVANPPEIIQIDPNASNDGPHVRHAPTTLD